MFNMASVRRELKQQSRFHGFVNSKRPAVITAAAAATPRYAAAENQSDNDNDICNVTMRLPASRSLVDRLFVQTESSCICPTTPAVPHRSDRKGEFIVP